MSTHGFVRLAGWVLAFAVTALPAHAQVARDDTASESKRAPIEITPFASLGSHFSSQIGAAIAFAWTSKISLEAEVGYRRGEVNALSSNVSLLYDLPRVRAVTPYLAGGVGLAQYASVIDVPQFGPVTHSQLAVTANAGGGLKVPVEKNWGFRTDARWFQGIGKAPEHWRVYNGVTIGAGRR